MRRSLHGVLTGMALTVAIGGCGAGSRTVTAPISSAEHAKGERIAGYAHRLIGIGTEVQAAASEGNVPAGERSLRKASDRLASLVPPSAFRVVDHPMREALRTEIALTRSVLRSRAAGNRAAVATDDARIEANRNAERDAFAEIEAVLARCEAVRYSC